MKRKQVAAILLSAIMAVSACVPMNGISAVAAEKDGAESTETSQVMEEPDEEVAPAPEADMPGEDPSGAEESEAELPEAAASEAEETEEEEPAANNTAGEEAGDPSAQQEADAPEAAQPEAATQDAPEAAQQEAAAQDAQDTPEAAQDAQQAAQEESAATDAEDHTAQPIEEEAREETGRPALRALQPEDFENAEEIYAGDEKYGDAFGDDYAVWEFVPDESGSYLFSTDSSLPVFLAIYDADYHKIADDGREWDSIERYFYMGMTYYLAAELAHPKDEDDDYISISLKQLEMPDLYVEGNEQSVIRVPYGEEAVLSVFAISSTGELYYRWED